MGRLQVVGFGDAIIPIHVGSDNAVFIAQIFDVLIEGVFQVRAFQKSVSADISNSVGDVYTV